MFKILDEDDCEIVTVTRVNPDDEKMALDSDNDDVQLIKVERVPEKTKNAKNLVLQSIINRLKEAKTESDVVSDETETKSDPLTIQRYFPCSEQGCKRIFATAVDLIQHSQTHKKRLRGKSRPKTTQKRFQCKVCASEFEKQVSLAAHMNMHRSTQDPVDFTFKCKDCNEMFRSNGSLWNHRKMKHMAVIHKCNICCKTFATESAYNEHIRKHESEGPILCNICQKSFTLQSSLTIHLRLHSRQLPFLCAKCGRSFNTNNRLQEHLRRHEGVRRYECNVCSKRFYEKTDLKKHAYTHNGNQRPHTCYYCGKGFILAGSLQIHIRTHTGKGSQFSRELI